MTDRRREPRPVYACMAFPPHLRRIHAPEDDPEVRIERRSEPAWRRLLHPFTRRGGGRPD